jgi:phosphoserine phosphatase RsbU/P
VQSSRPAETPPNAQRLQSELGFLAELSLVVASNTELQPILDWLVQKTTGMMGADEGSIKLLGPDVGAPAMHTLIRRSTPGTTSGSWPAPFTMSVIGYLLYRGDHLATPDLIADERFQGLAGNTDTRIRAVLAVPLKVEGRVTGMLAVTQATPGRQWNSDEVQLMTIVASYSAGVIEQARLRSESLEKQRLEEESRRIDRELSMARDMQMSLVPSRPLPAGAWEIWGRVIPARQVGGDAFDYFAVGEERVSLAIADVSGKGVPAALLMANVQASLRAFCNGRTRIEDALRMVNESVVRSASTGKFITLFYGEFDTASGRLRYSNAGHNYPLLRRASGEVELLMTGGLPLGILEQAAYEVGEIALVPGDTLLLYSDGVSEAMDLAGAEFGEDRLRAIWARTGAGAAAEVVATVLGEVEQFRGRATQSDDITLVVLGPAQRT